MKSRSLGRGLGAVAAAALATTTLSLGAAAPASATLYPYNCDSAKSYNTTTAAGWCDGGTGYYRVGVICTGDGAVMYGPWLWRSEYSGPTNRLSWAMCGYIGRPLSGWGVRYHWVERKW